MEERYIASVDLGTSKIAVCIARIAGQNTEVVYYKETKSDGIRHSYVLQPTRVKNEVAKALNDAQQELRIKISQVVVGLPRWEVKQVTATARMEREDDGAEILESEVRMLKSDALDSYDLDDPQTEVIYGAVAQSFSTEDRMNEVESEIVGMTASRLEGNFKVFIGNRRHSANIDNVFSKLGITIAKKFFTPGITAKAVLKEEQMDSGVAIMDLGAGTSSVAIFKGKILRYYASIPFGGNSITNDIKTECNISFELAENIKKAYGACMPNKLSSFGEKIIQINDENDNPTTRVSVKYLSEIITARMTEIVNALLYKIQESGYSQEGNLSSGIIVTGGGAELVNCTNLIKEISGYSVKLGTPRPFFSGEGFDKARTASAATTMGMIMASRADRNLNCTSRPLAVPAQPAKPETKPARPEVQPRRTDAQQTHPEVSQAPAAPVHVTPAAPAAQPATAQSPLTRPKAEPKPAEEPVYQEPEAVQEETEEKPVPTIEQSVKASQQELDFEGTVFGAPEEEPATRPERPVKKPKITWVQRVQKKIIQDMGSIFDDMKE